MRRRTFLASALALPAMRASRAAAKLDLAAIERTRVLRAANKYLGEAPVTVTAAGSPRSAGGKHDFFSEGDYWWPDPGNPKGPYIQRDGMTNPDNFVEHRRAMIRLSLAVPALAAAYKITKDRKYAPARHDPAQPGGARAGRGVQDHQGSQVRRACRHPPARLVCGRGHAHEPEPRIRAGHPGALHAPGHRDHRHAAPDGRGARCLATRSETGRSRGDEGLVRVLYRLDDDAPLRHRGARRQKQSRHVLVHAGGGVRPTHRQPGTTGVVPQPL